MKITKKPVLVLDLDGTLIDSRGDLVAALNAAIGTVGMAPVAISDIGEIAGKGAHAMISRACDIHRQTLSDGIRDQVTVRFLDYYQAHIADTSKPFPGALQALDKFQKKGWLLAICTNKLEYLAKLLLDKLELSTRFAAICGSDTFNVRKPDGQHILQTIETAGGEVSTSIMVGDTPTDIQAANDAGVLAIAVDFGNYDKPADVLSADCIISQFDELWMAAKKLNR